MFSSSPGRPLDLYAGTQFDDSIGGQFEVFRYASSVARHDGKQPLSPMRHSAARRRHHYFATEEIGSLQGLEFQPEGLARRQQLRQIDLVLEAIVGGDLVAVVGQP